MKVGGFADFNDVWLLALQQNSHWAFTVNYCFTSTLYNYWVLAFGGSPLSSGAYRTKNINKPLAKDGNA
jgi:hypothetical protein